MCQNAQVIVCMLNKRIVNILPWVYRVDIHMDRHTVIHMWSRWTCKAFLQILEPWLEYPKYYPFGFLLIHPPFEKLSSTNRIQTNLPLIIVFVLAGGLPFAPSGGSQQPLWWQKTTLEADRYMQGVAPCEMRVIKVVLMICGNYMKVLWKMIPVDYGPMVSRSASVQGFAMLQYCPFCGSLTLDISNQSTCCWQPKVHQLICGFIWMNVGMLELI